MQHRVGGKRRSWRLKKKWSKYFISQIVDVLGTTLDDISSPMIIFTAEQIDYNIVQRLFGGKA